MATNTERRTPFDLRTTIPLAKATLVSLARKPKRSWLIPFLTLITGIAFATLMLELMFSPGPLSALAFEGELRSKLSADYGADPLGAKIHELRLTIMDEVLGGGRDQNTGQAPADPELLDPVPTATEAAQQDQTPTTEPSTVVALTATDTPIVAASATASNTPLPAPIPTTPAVSLCNKLSILSMSIEGDDKLKASVRNDASVKAFLTDTFLDWPDVPSPAYVDWFEFSGNRYYDGNDSSSPTSKSGTNRTLNGGSTRTWEADWDDEPDEGIYGSFGLTLIFNFPGQGSCTLSTGVFKDMPAALVPSPTQVPPTETAPAPTGTPVLTETPASTPTPSDTPLPTPTPA